MSAKAEDSCKELFSRLGILTLYPQYIFSALMFVIKHKDTFTIKCIATPIVGMDMELLDEDQRWHCVVCCYDDATYGYQGTLLCAICLTDLLQSFTCDNFLWNLLSLEYNFTEIPH
jgi:hypothetical protein